MKITLDYGESGLEVNIPDSHLLAIAQQKDEPAIDDPQTVLRQMLARPIGVKPLAEICRGCSSACIVVSDKTRPVPNTMILPPLLEVLDNLHIKTTILVACGMHTPTEGKVLEDLLGKEIVSRYRIINHLGEDERELKNLGTTSKGAPVFVNRHYLEADLRIVTGFIEPHFMAGFSGGRKAICPGISGAETMKYAHSPELMEAPCSSSGIIPGNPFHEFSLEVAKMARVDFMVNVTLRRDKKITGIFTGDLEKAHAEGVAFCNKQARVALPAEADIVVTTNAGYPLDQDLYQTVKGMVCALPAVKDGGTIIIASACSRGIGSDLFRKMLFEMRDVDSFMAMIKKPGFFCIDQWEVEELIKAKRKADIKIYTTGVPADDLRKCHVDPIPSVEQGIKDALRKHGRNARITVIPSGPYVIPYIGG
ncbi:MAG: nickel-dependent lactate racemase [Kiritimatiellae bacterium]|nr:nickel-dependent lactate racemase [Kiritimatiellia bacterium]MDD5519683.1 nickel-dependent lactate racemase [Kiritimatiellia bacterium]